MPESTANQASDGIFLYTTPYNGTSPTGGDSLTENLNIHYEVRNHSDPPSPQNLLCANRDTIVWRYRLDARINRPCPSHDTWRWVCHCFLPLHVFAQSGQVADTPHPQILLLRPGAKKVGLVFNMAVHDVSRSDLLSVVLLGIFSGLFTHCREIHW